MLLVFEGIQLAPGEWGASCGRGFWWERGNGGRLRSGYTPGSFPDIAILNRSTDDTTKWSPFSLHSLQVAGRHSRQRIVFRTGTTRAPCGICRPSSASFRTIGSAWRTATPCPMTTSSRWTRANSACPTSTSMDPMQTRRWCAATSCCCATSPSTWVSHVSHEWSLRISNLIKSICLSPLSFPCCCCCCCCCQASCHAKRISLPMTFSTTSGALSTTSRLPRRQLASAKWTSCFVWRRWKVLRHR